MVLFPQNYKKGIEVSRDNAGVKPAKSGSRAKGRITLNDVAKTVGVSAITISRALNDPDKVKPVLRARIEKAVAELNYVPNRAARSLAAGSTQTLAVVIPTISNTVFSNVLKGIYDQTIEHNYEVLFANTYYSLQNEEKVISKLLAQYPDGIITTGLDMTERSKELLQAANIPLVQIMEVGAGEVLDMNVGFSHFDAGASMAEYLLAQGYRNIGFLGAQMDFRSQRRMQGFLSKLADANLETDKYLMTTTIPSSVKLGGHMIADLLSEHPQVDAVFCNNDDLAYGAIFECQRRKLRIPEQIAIAGFNDLDASASINPSLTTIRTPLYEIGNRATELLINTLKRRPNLSKTLDLGFELIARDSA
ncbi:MAG: LacI family DNA-binding transcriptional regulator [Oceanospirillaceae bacterium]|nr:LacI family DNA-binding transcriptional regulator [Oceanospirillaceae bacterium]